MQIYFLLLLCLLFLLIALQSLMDLSLSLKKLLNRTYFSWGWVVSPMPYPEPRGPGYPFFFWAITFDLSGMGGSTSSYATSNISQDHLTMQVPTLLLSMDTFGPFICRNDFIMLSRTAGFRGL